MDRARFFSYLVPSLVFIFALFSGVVIYRAADFVNDRHFSLLAYSFIKNDLFLNPINLPQGDYVDFRGKQYLFFGPMPSILLIPAVLAFGKDFNQSLLQIASLGITFAGIFLLCRQLKFSKINSFWLANFFVFGTVLYFVGLVKISAYLVQAVGTAFLVLALLEYLTYKRWLVVGILVAAAGATRVTLFGMVVFFLLEIFRTRRKVNLTQSLILLLLPIIFSMSMLAIYNFRRFGSFFDSGYTKNVSALDKDYYNYKFGFFSPVHIPANLYALLLMAPDPVKRDFAQFTLSFPYLKANGFGMGILFTSPLFLYLLLAKRQAYSVSAALGVVVIALPSLVYWGIGASQFGYRYSLDFLPLLFLLLLSAFKENQQLPKAAKALIIYGVFFNSFYMLSIWNSYPLLHFWQYLD